MSKKYFGRTTEVTLADGKAYKFAALPWTEKTEKIVEQFSNGEKHLSALREAMVYSLSFFYSEEEIAELFESSCIPLMGDNEEVISAIMGAMFLQKGGAEKKAAV